MTLEPLPTTSYVDKETQISVEDNPEQRQVCRTTDMTMDNNPLERQLDYWKKQSIKAMEEVKELGQSEATEYKKWVHSS